MARDAPEITFGTGLVGKGVIVHARQVGIDSSCEGTSAVPYTVHVGVPCRIHDDPRHGITEITVRDRRIGSHGHSISVRDDDGSSGTIVSSLTASIMIKISNRK